MRGEGLVKVRIGTIVETGKPFLVDDEELNETRLLIVANSGGGKSYAFRKLNEVLHRRVPCGIIDWKGEYHTLREKFDYVLCGGDNSEVRLQYHAARLRPRMPDDEREREMRLEEESQRRTVELARRLLKLRESFVVDLSAIVHKLDRLAFVGAFVSAIGPDAPKSLWRAIMVWVDEVHLMCPEKDDPTSKQPVIDLMSLTRQRGAGGMAATQRLSKYEKDGEAEANNYLVGRTALDGDLQRSCKLLGFSTKMWPVLKKLKPGQFFGFGPAFNVDEPMLVQIDPVETTHPRAGRIRARVRLRTSTHLRRSLKSLADLPVIVPGKVVSVTETTEALKSQITKLEGELKMAKAGRVVSRTVEIEVPILTPKDRRILAKASAVAEKLAKSTERYVGEVKILVGHSNDLQAKAVTVQRDLSKLIASLEVRADGESAPRPDALTASDGGEIAAPAALPPAKLARIAESGDVKLEDRHRKVMGQLAVYHPEAIDHRTLAADSAYTPGSRSFLDILRDLRRADLFIYGKGPVSFTPKGVAELKLTRGPATGWNARQHLEHWLRESGTMLEDRHRKVLKLIFDAGGPVAHADIAVKADYTPGSRSYLDILRDIRRYGLIHYGSGANVSCTSFLLRK